ncbi:hypothetical protein KKC1_14100, partial [Calderihabitans maritimus]
RRRLTESLAERLVLVVVRELEEKEIKGSVLLSSQQLY